MLAPQGVKGTKADFFIILYIEKQIEHTLLPGVVVCMLFKLCNRFLLIDPFQNIVNILKVIIKGAPV